MLFGKKKEVKPEIYSEDTCQVCDKKTRRRFEEGDYIYKPGKPCEKCSSLHTLVTAVYGEYPEEKR